MKAAHLQDKNTVLARHNTLLAVKLRESVTKLDQSIAQQFLADAKNAALMAKLDDLQAQLRTAQLAVDTYKAKHAQSMAQYAVMKEMSASTHHIFHSLVAHLREMADNLDSNVVSAWSEIKASLDTAVATPQHQGPTIDTNTTSDDVWDLNHLKDTPRLPPNRRRFSAGHAPSVNLGARTMTPIRKTESANKRVSYPVHRRQP